MERRAWMLAASLVLLLAQDGMSFTTPHRHALVSERSARVLRAEDRGGPRGQRAERSERRVEKRPRIPAMDDGIVVIRDGEDGEELGDLVRDDDGWKLKRKGGAPQRVVEFAPLKVEPGASASATKRRRSSDIDESEDEEEDFRWPAPGGSAAPRGGRGRVRPGLSAGRGRGQQRRSSDRAYPKGDDYNGGGGRSMTYRGEHTEAKGSKAWMADDLEAPSDTQRPAWKVPKDGYGLDGAAEMPSWLPPQGGLKEERGPRPLPLPPALEKLMAQRVPLEELEERLRKKFVGNKKAVAEAEEEYYDKDDDGFEEVEELDNADEPAIDPESEAVEVALPKPSAVAVVSAEAAAKEGGFRIRPRITVPDVTSDQSVDDRGAQAVDKSEVESAAELKRAAKEKEAELKKKQDVYKIEYVEHLTLESVPIIENRVGESFKELGVTDPAVLENLNGLGIERPTYVQAAALTAMLKNGQDVIIHAHTGSGKTLAFLLPLIDHINRDSDEVQAIVIAPGRELGSQIYSVAEQIMEGSGIRSQMIIGGANVLRQIERLKKTKPHVLIGTPGRICELVQEKKRAKLSAVTFVVLDEIDSLMRTPYDAEVDSIIRAVGNRQYRQTVFASATGRSPVVEEAASRYMKDDYMFISGGPEGESAVGALPPNIRHAVVTSSKVKKFETLRRFMNSQPFPESVMVFVNDPHQVRWLTEKLELVGIVAAPLSGESVKEDRTEIMRRLADGRLAMVVTTEMAARGIDVPQLTHVVNYDLPTDAEHYVHRAGRCGRAGRPGIVVNMALPETKFVMNKFGEKLALKFDDAEMKDGKLWAVTRTKVVPEDGSGLESKAPRKRRPSRKKAEG